MPQRPPAAEPRGRVRASQRAPQQADATPNAAVSSDASGRFNGSDRTPPPVSLLERADVRRWIVFAFVARFALAMFFEVSGVERSMRLTRDAFLYERVGAELADYWRSDGATPWPSRVGATPLDCLFEYEVGVVSYLSGGSLLLIRLINVIAGTLVPLVVWKTARLLFDPVVSRRALIGSAFFPTQVYYSAIGVRDAQSTLAMCLVFYGLTAIVAQRSAGRSALALPAGLLLIAGFRTYMFTLIVVMIPLSWAAAAVLIRSSGKARFLSRAVTVGVLCGAIAGGLGLNSVFSGNEGSQITDVNFLNKIRQKMNRGGGALYDEGEVPLLFEDAGSTATAIGVGLYHFLFSVNPTEIDSARQFMALPEVLLVVVAIPSLWRGFLRARRHYPLELAAPLLIALAITFAYSSVATNGGPMMRWRLQTVNVYIIIAALGWDRVAWLPGRTTSPSRGTAGGPGPKRKRARRNADLLAKDRAGDRSDGQTADAAAERLPVVDRPKGRVRRSVRTANEAMAETADAAS